MLCLSKQAFKNLCLVYFNLLLKKLFVTLQDIEMEISRRSQA